MGTNHCHDPFVTGDCVSKTRLVKHRQGIINKGGTDSNGIDDSMHMHTYMHTYIHMHIYTHTHIHTCLHTYTHIRTHIHVHTYIHTDIHTYIHAMLTESSHTMGRKGSTHKIRFQDELSEANGSRFGVTFFINCIHTMLLPA